MGTGKKVTFAAGYISDEALKFLREHGACIDTALGLSMIELPENAEICKPGYQCPPSEYAVQWVDEEGNDPLEWLELTLPMAKARGFFLQRLDLLLLRLEGAAEVRSPEAFCGSCPLVPVCPTVPFRALERMLRAAL